MTLKNVGFVLSMSVGLFIFLGVIPQERCFINKVEFEKDQIQLPECLPLKYTANKVLKSSFKCKY